MAFKYNLINNKQLGLFNPLESILKNRGIENINEFLNLSINYLEDESLYDNIHLAFETLIYHIQRDSKITILVDSDPDGYTSAAIMYQYSIMLINKYNSKSIVEYIIHNDKSHGLDKETQKKLDLLHTDLIIIPDASSNDYEEHKKYKNNNIDIIILDHHEADKYSECAIVVNNQLSKNITNKTLTGVGVVYKFCKYIDKQLNITYSDQFLDLVALGMIADSCDLRNLESRYLVLEGLSQIEKDQNKNKLISAMIKEKAYDMKNEITIIGIAFYIIPFINSIIRTGTYEEKELMFKAFLNSDETHIDKIRGKGDVELSIQDHVVRIAKKAKRKQDKIINDSLDILNEQINNYNLNDNGVIIVNGKDIDENYTGLIANKLAGIYQKPCLVLRENKDIYSGSGRGFERKDIKDFRQWCINTNLFELAEGHSNAFGLKIHNDNLNKLYEKSKEVNLSEELIYDVDGVLNEKTLNKQVIEVIAKYKNTWGTTIYEPLFAIENLVINTKDIELIGKSKNTIKMKYNNIELIKFKTNEESYNEIIQNKAINLVIVGKFSINEYMGEITPQVIIEDMMYTPTKVKFRF